MRDSQCREIPAVTLNNSCIFKCGLDEPVKHENMYHLKLFVSSWEEREREGAREREWVSHK